MLLIVIPAVWLAIAGIVVLLCRTAARGDAALAASPQRGTPSRTMPGLVLFESHDSRVGHDERIGLRLQRAAARPAARGRRARCVVR